MDKIHDSAFASPTLKGRVRMAYSFKGYQPVLCTLLCDQPLYYMKDEIFEDEQDSLFLEEEQMVNAALAADLGGIQKKIGIYDEMAKKYAAAPDARMEIFRDNAQTLGLRENDDAPFLMALVSLLENSRYAQSMLALCDARGVEIAASRQIRGASYDARTKKIFINPEQNAGDALLSAAAALRHHAQEANGAGSHPLRFHPDEAVLVNRAQAADRAVAQVRAAWELQLAGIGDAWDRLENSQGCDLARAFAREALCDFRTLNNGKAMQAAFESWFLSDRCKIEDRELIQAMLTDQETRLFDMPQEHVSPGFIAALGEQTLGRNYLSEQTGALLGDPIFFEVRDRSNANFLWFVKFERSFNQAEQELQGEEGETIHSFELPQGAASAPGTGTKNDAKTTACEWDAAESSELGILAGLEAGSNRSNVVYVSFGGSF